MRYSRRQYQAAVTRRLRASGPQTCSSPDFISATAQVAEEVLGWQRLEISLPGQRELPGFGLFGVF